MKYNLLFVDDEEQILEGIQDSLRKFRKQWSMTFVCGGEAAIVELSMRPFDVLICDMRMPQVDGVDVLRYVHISAHRDRSFQFYVTAHFGRS